MTCYGTRLWQPRNVWRFFPCSQCEPWFIIWRKLLSHPFTQPNLVSAAQEYHLSLSNKSAESYCRSQNETLYLVYFWTMASQWASGHWVGAWYISIYHRLSKPNLFLFMNNKTMQYYKKFYWIGDCVYPFPIRKYRLHQSIIWSKLVTSFPDSDSWNIL